MLRFVAPALVVLFVAGLAAGCGAGGGLTGTVGGSVTRTQLTLTRTGPTTGTLPTALAAPTAPSSLSATAGGN